MAPQLPPESNLSAYSRAEIERPVFRERPLPPEEASFFKDRDSRFVLVSSGWLEPSGTERPLTR